jgi:hypothetical protein
MGKNLFFSLGPNLSIEVYRTTPFYLYRPAQTASPFGLSAHLKPQPISHLPKTPQPLTCRVHRSAFFSPSLFLSVFLPVTHSVGAEELAPAPPWPPPPPRCCPAMPAMRPRSRIRHSSGAPNPSRSPIKAQSPSATSCPPPPLGDFAPVHR